MEKETTISIIAIILGAVGLIFPIFIPSYHRFWSKFI